MSRENSSSSGIGVTGLLGVAFVVLKLTNVISWSWWWVLCPFWAMFALFVLVLIVWLIVQLTRKTKPSIKQDVKKEHRSKFDERLEEAKRKQLNK